MEMTSRRSLSARSNPRGCGRQSPWTINTLHQSRHLQPLQLYHRRSCQEQSRKRTRSAGPHQSMALNAPEAETDTGLANQATSRSSSQTTNDIERGSIISESVDYLSPTSRSCLRSNLEWVDPAGGAATWLYGMISSDCDRRHGRRMASSLRRSLRAVLIDTCHARNIYARFCDT